MKYILKILYKKKGLEHITRLKKPNNFISKNLNNTSNLKLSKIKVRKRVVCLWRVSTSYLKLFKAPLKILRPFCEFQFLLNNINFADIKNRQFKTTTKMVKLENSDQNI